ncbi:hypothetical protein NKH80_03030 [Mesorhizobium sp. M0904]|uniref:hypothetical protein n=1 Tax=Mesorhizobium sp. M0904 TaxID=2957022 RepID=UPI00333D653F
MAGARQPVARHAWRNLNSYSDAGAADCAAQPPDDGASYVEASDTLPMDGYVPSQEAGAA